MAREWKPGDVVTATVNGRDDVRLIAGWSKYDPQLRWGEMSPRWGDGDDDECWFMPSQVTNRRPLVVIDPENREQVERLVDRLAAARFWEAIPVDEPGVSYRTSQMQAALREFANPTPPKPAEPQGLGAVVEDAFGHVFVRLSTSWFNVNDDQHCTWDHINAVRVLSEGVQ